jgi:hypothetical protein
LEDENKSLYKQLEVMKNKHLMAHNLGLARLKRIEGLQEQNETKDAQIKAILGVKEWMCLCGNQMNVKTISDAFTHFSNPSQQILDLKEQVMRYHQTVEEKDKEINKLKQSWLNRKLCWVCGKSWNDSSRKQHDCNTNKELDNQYKLISDLKSQLKQLGAKYKNLQKVQSDLVEKNKQMAEIILKKQIIKDISKKCKFGFDFCICPDERTK